MAGLFRNITKKVLISLNVAVGAAMLLLYTLPFSNQDYFWMLNIIALVFPVLLIIQLLFFIGWLIAKPRLALLPLFFCLLSYKLIFSVFGIQSASSNKAVPKDAYHILSWNAHTFNFYENNGKPEPVMMEKVRRQNADIFCVQELVFSSDSLSSFSFEKMKKKLGYKYGVAANDRSFGVHTNIRTSKEKYHPFCIAIFSKYPIIQWKKVQVLPEYNHTFLWADIKLKEDTVRVFNIHLQSMYLVKDDYYFIENIDQQDVDQVSNRGKYILNKLKNANYLRAIQILDVKQSILESPHPVMLCGDFNDVPNSYAYRQIRSLLQDAFIKKGSGIGRTFVSLSPTLRIDYIFYPDHFTLHNFKIHQWQMSDHNSIEAAFSIADTE
jgi:endonuclease/exonuclease/phosphatase family metal-dependent hydrolase